MSVKTNLEPLPHLHADSKSPDGLWLDDDFLWDMLPRLTPLAVYVCLAVGRHRSLKRYPSISDIAVELGRSRLMVAQAVRQLKELGLFNDHDVRRVLTESENEDE